MRSHTTRRGRRDARGAGTQIACRSHVTTSRDRSTWGLRVLPVSFAKSSAVALQTSITEEVFGTRSRTRGGFDESDRSYVDRPRGCCLLARLSGGGSAEQLRLPAAARPLASEDVCVQE